MFKTITSFIIAVACFFFVCVIFFFSFLKKKGPASKIETTKRIINQLYMLIDFTASQPGHTIRNITIESPVSPRTNTGAQIQPATLTIFDILKKINDVETNIEGSTTVVSSDDLAVLRLTKDALTAQCGQQTGISIAYTSIYLGGFFKNKSVRAQYADIGYPFLRNGVFLHRISNVIILMLAVVITLLTVLMAARVAGGKSLLQGRQELRAQQSAINSEKLRAETSDKSTEWRLPSFRDAQAENNVSILNRNFNYSKLSFDFCDRPRILAGMLKKYDQENFNFSWPTEQPKPGVTSETNPFMSPGDDLRIFEIPQQQDICDRDQNLAGQFKVSSKAILNYLTYQKKSYFQILTDIITSNNSAVETMESLNNKVQQESDLEFKVAPELLVCGNFILPLLFSFLGASAYVLLDFYTKLRNNLLTPPDHMLGWVRLVLGLMIGASIGLFYSSYNVAPLKSGDDLIGALTLSASGVAFLAGFGVEGVFQFLRELVTRVFPANLTGK